MHPLESLNREIIQCRKCPRLVEWREEVARVRRKAYKDQEYWGKPVPGFGDPKARILVVGLAPGAHGSNRTGRQFTGDASGDFLFPALRRAGFASQAEAKSRNDGMTLKDLYITASARCVPPDNKPTPAELTACQPYLEREIQILQPKVIVCLGKIAFDRIFKIFSLRGLDFSHGVVYALEPSSLLPHPSFLIGSYHPSQQNTLTGKLTAEMFDEIWKRAKEISDKDR
ncbi:MAG: uracil-DNA glycosylase [Chloroflexi bacterium]|nr:uracil-DNA glycosylase [Chloroflexota bacterium]MCA2001263.1 uracil-DNA glycosylase [Chloroflexota bacterium]